MEKQDNKYTATKVIAVITIILLTTIIIFKNRLLQLTAIYPTVPQEVFSRNIVSRDITQEISNIKRILDSAKLPDDIEAVTYIRNMVENALNAWAECQELVNSKKVNVQYRSGELYMARYEDTLSRILFRFFLQSDKGKIRQCKKIVLRAEISSNKTRKRQYDLQFNEDFNIKRYEDQNGEVSFYPSGSIERILFDTTDGKRLYIRWSEDGNITHQNIE
jgi:hypothetical protein